MLGQSITKNSLILGLFALVTAGIVAATFQGTKERITLEEKRAAEKALLEIIPASRHDNDMLTSVIAVPPEHLAQLGLDNAAEIHVALMGGSPVAVIIPTVAPDGYSGDIKMIVGINSDGSVAGVRVLSHRETPGLGDKVEIRKSNWILGFEGKSLENPALEKWRVKKDGGEFDQFTGATITPRAVVNAVRNTLEYFDQNRDYLLKEINSAQGQQEQ